MKQEKYKGIQAGLGRLFLCGSVSIIFMACTSTPDTNNPDTTALSSSPKKEMSASGLNELSTTNMNQIGQKAATLKPHKLRL